MTLIEEFQKLIPETLDALSLESAKLVGPSKWEWLLLANSHKTTATAQIGSNGRLNLETAAILDFSNGKTPTGAKAAQALYRLLDRNSLLTGGAGYSLFPDNSIRARAEIMLDQSVKVSERIREACAGLVRASEGVLNPPADNKPTPVPDATDSKEEKDGQELLVKMLEDTEWAPSPKPDGTVSVTLQSDAVIRQATLKCETGGARRISVKLLRVETKVTPLIQLALAVFMLRAGATFRMAAPTLQRPAEGVNDLMLETVFDTPPAPVEAANALGTLSAACEYCARECQALTDEGIAKEYLRRQGGPFRRSAGNE